MCAYVNSDWASNLKHKNSVMGIVVMYAGGVIGYKIKYQETITHSLQKQSLLQHVMLAKWSLI